LSQEHFLHTFSRLFLILISTRASAAPRAFIGVAPTYRAYNAASPGTSIVVAPGSYVAITSNNSPPLDFGSGDGLTVELSGTGFTGTIGWRPVANAPWPEIGPVIWAALPSNAPLGRATISLRRNGGSFGSMPVDIVRNAPGLFTKNYQGYGPAIAQTYINFFGPFLQPSNVALTENATPDHFVTLIATGLGDASASDVTVELAGQSIPVTYAGGHGENQFHEEHQFHDQINFLMPANPPIGCYVPIAIRVRGVLSNQGTLSVNGDRYACAHPLGLSYADLKTLDNGASVPIARVQTFTDKVLTDNLGGVRLNESAAFTMLNLDANAMFLFAGRQGPDPVYFTCTTQESFGTVLAVEVPGFGPLVTLSGPGGKSLLLVSPYAADAPPGREPYFSPGVWQAATPGNNDFFGFQQTFVLPPVISAINLAFGQTVSKGHDLQVTWNPSGFTSNDIVTVDLLDDTVGSPAVARCGTYGWAGQLTIPQSLVAPFVGQPNTAVRVTVTPHPAGRTRFILPRKDGYAMRGYTSYQYMLTVPVKVE